MRRLALLLAALLAVAAPASFPALAADPAEMLKDPALEKRAHDLGKDLRCLVCQNESIEDSNADLARDLRIIVRERITAGDSDGEVMKFVVDRYGDYVLLKPPFKATTLVLWVGPFALFVVALAVVWRVYGRRAAAAPSMAPAPLTAEEKRRLDALLKADNVKDGGGR